MKKLKPKQAKEERPPFGIYDYSAQCSMRDDCPRHTSAKILKRLNELQKDKEKEST
jgi:hypothetical protein